MHRVFDDQLDAHHRRQVDNEVRLAGQPVEHLAVGDRLAHELEARQRAQVLDIFQPPGSQVINRRHLVAFMHQRFTQMTANEACPAGNQNFFFHKNPSFVNCVTGKHPLYY